MMNRLLGTPDENTWPGVTSFPDFKSSFPKWGRDESRPLIAGLDEHGLDLLDAFLVYDPAGRISAKQACEHPYFEQGSALWAARTAGTPTAGGGGGNAGGGSGGGVGIGVAAGKNGYR